MMLIRALRGGAGRPARSRLPAALLGRGGGRGRRLRGAGARRPAALQRPLDRAGAGARARARAGDGRTARQGRRDPVAARAGAAIWPSRTRDSSAPMRWWRAISASPPASPWRRSSKAIGRIVVCIFGDGACGAGALHETLNIAALWRLPLLLVCDNNQLSVSTPRAAALAPARLSDLAAPFGVPGATVDGMDVRGGARRRRAVRRPGAGRRWAGLPGMRVRTLFQPLDRDARDALGAGHARRARSLPDSPIRREAARGGPAGRCRRWRASKARSTTLVADGAGLRRRLALSRTRPRRSAMSSEAAGRSSCSSARPSPRAVREEMAADERVILLGQDVGAFGGSYKEFVGLFDQFGAARVRDTPVAEAAMVGAGRRRGGGGLSAAGQHHLYGLPDAGPRPAGELRRQGPVQDRRADHRSRRWSRPPPAPRARASPTRSASRPG